MCWISNVVLTFELRHSLIFNAENILHFRCWFQTGWLIETVDKKWTKYRCIPADIQSFIIGILQNIMIHIKNRKNNSSPAGNRTPVSRVTGGDTYHYTTEELRIVVLKLISIVLSLNKIHQQCSIVVITGARHDIFVF